MTDETGKSLLPGVQSKTQKIREMNVTFAEDVSILTEDFFNIRIFVAEETPQISTQAATTNQMKTMIMKTRNQNSKMKAFIAIPFLEGYIRKIWEKHIIKYLLA